MREAVLLLAVAAVEGHLICVDSHCLGAPYLVRPDPHGLFASVGAYLGEREVGVVQAQAVVPDTLRA
ncbi:hypothetical protein KPP03845_100089 [Streptomyces xanthophaeus]|nr:hypothetical protein KPP03845_100089 [Streptomyces xanthophaeus]